LNDSTLSNVSCSLSLNHYFRTSNLNPFIINKYAITFWGNFMMTTYETILEGALKLRPIEKANLIEFLMSSLEKPDAEIDAIWEEEAIKRYKAWREGRLKVKDLDEVLKKYE